MYYRFEVCLQGFDNWLGICTILNGYELRQVGRFLTEPRWYKKNPDVRSECWFTEYGYQKYKEKMQEIINHMPDWHSEELMRGLKFRVREQEELKNIVMHGKVQCICIL